MPRRRLLGALSLALAFAAETAGACQLTPEGVQTVARVVDGAMVVLDDGRTVRLASVLAPRSEDAGAERGLWQPELEAQTALERLVGSQTVGVVIAGKSDRYGRQVAHLMLIGRGPVPVWVQAYLVENGHVRAAIEPDGDPCGRRLVQREQVARAGLLGLWRNAVYRPLEAADVRTLEQRRDTYPIVRGHVAAANTVRSQIYLNFGTNWREDFTVAVKADVRHALGARGIDPAALAGRTVEVRGWIERRNGPMIWLRHADDLTLVDPVDAAADQ